MSVNSTRMWNKNVLYKAKRLCISFPSSRINLRSIGVRSPRKKVMMLEKKEPHYGRL